MTCRPRASLCSAVPQILGVHHWTGGAVYIGVVAVRVAVDSRNSRYQHSTTARRDSGTAELRNHTIQHNVVQQVTIYYFLEKLAFTILLLSILQVVYF